MAKITFSPRKVTLALSAMDWQLYSSMEGVEEVAVKINKAVEVAINESTTKIEAGRKVDEVLNTYRKFGASDTEPCGVARDLLRRAFNNADDEEDGDYF